MIAEPTDALRRQLVRRLVALMLRERATKLERMDVYESARRARLEYASLTREAELAREMVKAVPAGRVRDLASHAAEAARMVAD